MESSRPWPCTSRSSPIRAGLRSFQEVTGREVDDLPVQGGGLVTSGLELGSEPEGWSTVTRHDFLQGHLDFGPCYQILASEIDGDLRSVRKVGATSILSDIHSATYRDSLGPWGGES